MSVASDPSPRCIILCNVRLTKLCHAAPEVLACSSLTLVLLLFSFPLGPRSALDPLFLVNVYLLEALVVIIVHLGQGSSVHQYRHHAGRFRYTVQLLQPEYVSICLQAEHLDVPRVKTIPACPSMRTSPILCQLATLHRESLQIPDTRQALVRLVSRASCSTVGSVDRRSGTGGFLPEHQSLCGGGSVRSAFRE